MQQIIVFIILALALALFIWNKIRYDIVALLALFAMLMLGIIPVEKAFYGFAHPAVITVIAVMIISKGMQNSGLVDTVARWMMRFGTNLTLMILSLSLLTAIASAFMNNVGALVITMPIGIQLAKKAGHSPSKVLMPLSFSSLLGGMVTMIGTPPNIIIASFRAEHTGQSFQMFDFARPGALIMLGGVLFISLIGWHLIPKRKEGSEAGGGFVIDDYITEVAVGEKSRLIGQNLLGIMKDKTYDITVLGLIREGLRIHIIPPQEPFRLHDILIIEADSDNLKAFVDVTKAELLGGRKFRDASVASKDIVIREVVVMQDSMLVGNSACQLNLRSHYGINLLAIARGERKFTKRISQSNFRAGDVLLIQGLVERMQDVYEALDVLPLTERGYRLGDESRSILTLSIFGGAIVATMLNLLPVQLAFTLAALLLVLTGVIPVKGLYSSVEWSVIVLLGAMIAVGGALESSGGSSTIARGLMGLGSETPLWLMLGLLMLICMIFANVINTATTAVLMAPIGIKLALGMGVSVDPFLLAVAIGASSSFLTPIGHQSNILVMGPGGYKFSDYWRMGLPLQILVLLGSVPLLVFFWA